MICFSVAGGPPQTYCDVCADWAYLRELEEAGQMSLLACVGITTPCAFCGKTGEDERQERYRKRHQVVKKDRGNT